MRAEYNTSQYSESSKSSRTESIRLEFSRHARRYLKKKIPKPHMKKHEISDELLTCHRKGKYYMINRSSVARLSRTRILSIVCIALNLTNDRIQVSDVLRFINEKHIFFGKNINKFFPKNHRFDAYGTKLINLNYNTINNNIQKTCRFLKINNLNESNVIQLCERYLDELCLPKIILKWIERLYVAHPLKPKHDEFFIKNEFIAMAYIIYFMKLIFGLDGYTEKALSQSAMLLNQKFGKNTAFVFTDWMNYIEMRKFLIDQWKEKWHINIDKSEDLNVYYEPGESKGPSLTFDTKFRENAPMRNILQECYNIATNNEELAVNFENSVPSATLTPQKDYLKLLIDNRESTSFFIPDFMHENHSSKNIEYLIHPNKFIRSIRKNHKINLMPKELPPQRDKFNVDPKNQFIARDPIKFCPSKYNTGGQMGKKQQLYKYVFVDENPKKINNIDENNDENNDFGARPYSWNVFENIPTDFADHQSEDDDYEDIDVNVDYDNLSFVLPHFHVWGFTLYQQHLGDLSQIMTNNVLDHGSKSFAWLLGMCASLINVPSKTLLKYLALIEHSTNHIIRGISDEPICV